MDIMALTSSAQEEHRKFWTLILGVLIEGMIIGSDKGFTFMKILIWQNGGPRQKQSKRKHCEYALVYKSDIICPLKHVLNLDDRNDLDIFIRSCLDFIKDLQRAYDKLPDFEIPKFRAIYFDYYKTQHDIHVIVRTFQKDAPKYAGTFRTGEELETQKELLGFLGLSYFETQICVSNADCINEVIKVYDKQS